MFVLNQLLALSLDSHVYEKIIIKKIKQIGRFGKKDITCLDFHGCQKTYYQALNDHRGTFYNAWYRSNVVKTTKNKVVVEIYLGKPHKKAVTFSLKLRPVFN